MYAQPSAHFEAILSGAPSALVDSLGFSVLQPSTSTTVVPRRTTGITEVAAGVYWTEDTAPAALGTYLIIWDYGGTTATEELLVVGTLPVPATGGAYTTETDVRIFAPEVTANVSADELVRTIAQAERDIDAALPFTFDLTDTGHKINPDDLSAVERRVLSSATAAQVEYRLYMGPGIFVEGGQAMTGGDITVTKPPPLLAPKARAELTAAGFIPMTGSMSRRTRPNLQRRFTW